MSSLAADSIIASRLILPMDRSSQVLDNHAIVVREGRIIDVLPSDEAADRYLAARRIDRPDHVLVPGLVNARAVIAPHLASGAASRERLEAAILLAIAEMLRSGTTCFAYSGVHPREVARAAVDHGIRLAVQAPIAAVASAWADSTSQYLTRALALRDEYRGSATITTSFALSAVDLDDATLSRVATLADELDTSIAMPLHASLGNIAQCESRFGVRPIERLSKLGLLTPALIAEQMTYVTPRETELVQRAGVAVVLCPRDSLLDDFKAPPVAAWLASGLRIGVGTAAESPDLWAEARLLDLLMRSQSAARHGAGDALAIATRGGAAALGLESELGSLEIGKCADIISLDAGHPAVRRSIMAGPVELGAELGRSGPGAALADVWVAGRHLLEHGAFKQLNRFAGDSG